MVDAIAEIVENRSILMGRTPAHARKNHFVHSVQIRIDSVIFRQPSPMRLDEFVHEELDLIRIQLRRGVRIEHGGVVDVLPLAGQRSFYRKRLYVDVGLHQRRQLRGQRSDP